MEHRSDKQEPRKGQAPANPISNDERGRDEQALLRHFEKDAARLELAVAHGLRVSDFHRSGNGERFVELGNRPRAGAPEIDSKTNREIRALVEMLQGINWDYPEPSPQQLPANGAPRQPGSPEPGSQPELKKAARPQSKIFAGKRRNMRRGELKVLVKYLPGKISINAIAAKFPERDIENPNDDGVSGREIGASVKLTLDQMFEIEDQATAFGAKWDRPGKKYRFSFRTIKCCDTSDKDVRTARKRRANKRGTEKKRKDRLEKTMPTTATDAGRPADLRQAQVLRTREQMEAIYSEIGTDQPTVDMLMEAVRLHPAWSQVEPAKMRRTMLDRLDMLVDEGRVKNCDELPGPRSSKRRTVRRT